MDWDKGKICCQVFSNQAQVLHASTSQLHIVLHPSSLPAAHQIVAVIAVIVVLSK